MFRFRTIRKKQNEIDIDAAKELLLSGRRGVLAVNGDDGYPYVIPFNYVYDKEVQKIYFHGARAGHKVDALGNCDKVCFTVFDVSDNLVQETQDILDIRECERSR